MFYQNTVHCRKDFYKAGDGDGLQFTHSGTLKIWVDSFKSSLYWVALYVFAIPPCHFNNVKILYTEI